MRVQLPDCGKYYVNSDRCDHPLYRAVMFQHFCRVNCTSIQFMLLITLFVYCRTTFESHTSAR